MHYPNWHKNPSNKIQDIKNTKNTEQNKLNIFV